MEYVSMFRLLVTGALVYVAYRVTQRMIQDTPDTVDPLLLPPPKHVRGALRRQSATSGVNARR
jgi:hypothetical protein